MEAVQGILAQLNLEDKPQLVVLNKIDLLQDPSIVSRLTAHLNAVAISAHDETTLPPLVDRIAELLHGWTP